MKAMRVFSSLLVFAGVCSAALADEPNVKDILTKVDSTTKALKSISYKSVWYAEGEAKDRVPRTEATVMSVVDDKNEESFAGKKLNFATNASLGGEKRSTQVISDGVEAIRIDHIGKKFLKGKADAADAMVGGRPGWLMIEFIHPTPFTDELNADKAVYEGKKTIGGTECHVIMVTYAGGQGESRWYFGVKDNLPHRVDRIQQGTVLELSDVDPSPKFDAATFAAKAPEGYTEDKPKAAAAPARETLLPKGSAAPAWTLKTPDDKAVSLSDLKGKVVVMDFWAVWCPPCKKAMPGVQKLSEKYKDKPVLFFGVNTWETKDNDPVKFMKDNGYTYGLLLAGDDVAKTYKVNGIPTFYVIAGDGTIVYTGSGFDEAKTDADLEKAIEEALAKKG